MTIFNKCLTDCGKLSIILNGYVII